MPGPLEGVRIVEIAGIGPAPFAGMMLADSGAEVIRIDRPGGVRAGPDRDASKDILNRSRTVLRVDLKAADGTTLLRDLVRSADGLIEGFRPGVMERLGLGPEVLLADNPRLVYGRMTGWGQTGPWAGRVGHDINYIALCGNLHGYGRAGGKPTPPINAVGDFGGGGMLLAFGMVSAILNARTTGRGQVIDCAMTDGAALLASMIWSFRAMGQWQDARGVNLLDTGAPFYDTYATADGEHVAIGPLESQFYAEFCRLTGLAGHPDFREQMNRASWPAQRRVLTELFLTKTRAEWDAVFDGSDACYAPVLSMPEALRHPHNLARLAFLEIDGVPQAAPAPRYSRTPADRPAMPAPPGEPGLEVLRELGYDEARITALCRAGVIVSGC